MIKLLFCFAHSSFVIIFAWMAHYRKNEGILLGRLRSQAIGVQRVMNKRKGNWSFTPLTICPRMPASENFQKSISFFKLEEEK